MDMSVKKEINYDIYEPEEDSYLLSKYVRKHVKKDDKVLEIGVGSGIQCENALNNINKENGKGIVLGIDINKDAIKYCKKSKYTQGGFFFESNLFEKFKTYTFDFKNKKLIKQIPKIKDNKFDTIIFNPPYLPDANDAEEIKPITTGGKEGFEIIDDFMKDASRFLNPEGQILMVFSNLTKQNRVNEIIEKYLFKYELLEEQSIFFEKLICYRITKKEILNNLENNKINDSMISDISYLSKGKRGFVYQGIINSKKLKLKNKKCTIKVQNTNTTAINVISKEVMWTKKVNKLGIGPRYYFSNTNESDNMNYIVREFVEGSLIVEWVENNNNNKKALREVFLDILNQCFVLDSNSLEKQEMTKPVKHIIIKEEINNTKNNKKNAIINNNNNNEINYIPVQIDFERMRKTLRPSNVTQYLQFLSSANFKKYLDINRIETSKLAKEYLETRRITNCINYINLKIK